MPEDTEIVPVTVFQDAKAAHEPRKYEDGGKHEGYCHGNKSRSTLPIWIFTVECHDAMMVWPFSFFGLKKEKLRVRTSTASPFSPCAQFRREHVDISLAILHPAR